MDDNIALKEVAGFGSLETVGGNFNMDDNTTLTSISGFNNLKKGAGNFNLDNNPVLSYISGFEKLQYVENNFKLHDNPQLGDCCVFYNLLNSGTIGGTVSIYNNSTGCDSEATIISEGSCPEPDELPAFPKSLGIIFGLIVVGISIRSILN